MNLDGASRQQKLELYYQFNTLVENARKDLTTGIKKEELEDLYNNNFILEKDYLEIKNSIESLENIISLYSPIVEQLKNELDN